MYEFLSIPADTPVLLQVLNLFTSWVLLQCCNKQYKWWSFAYMWYFGIAWRVTLCVFDCDLIPSPTFVSVFSTMLLCAVQFAIFLSVYQSTNHSNLMILCNSCRAKWLFLNKSALRCQSRTAGWVSLTVTFITMWNTTWLCSLNHDWYEQLLDWMITSLSLKTAQRWFGGQRIRTVNPVVSCLWGGSPRGAGQQRDHWHWSSRSVTCSPAQMWAWHMHTHWMRNHVSSPSIPPLTVHKRCDTLCVCVCQAMIWSTNMTPCCSSRRSLSSWETSSLRNRVSWSRLHGLPQPLQRQNLCSSITRGRVRDGEESKYVLLWVDSRGEGQGD